MTQRTRNVRKAWEFSGPEGKSPTIRDIVEGNTVRVRDLHQVRSLVCFWFQSFSNLIWQNPVNDLASGQFSRTVVVVVGESPEINFIPLSIATAE